MHDEVAHSVSHCSAHTGSDQSTKNAAVDGWAAAGQVDADLAYLRYAQRPAVFQSGLMDSFVSS